MKRSFLSVIALSSIVALGACAGDDDADDIEPVEEIQTPAPPPAPLPVDSPADTLGADTMATTGL